jgi:hypothetical protein
VRPLSATSEGLLPVAVNLRLLGANRHPQVAARDALPGRVNYFLGSDAARWRSDIPTCGRVEYSSVYRGIDPWK